MKIGVFDSGVGGLSVANAIKEALPDVEVILKEDKANVPYGTRSPEEILGFITPIFQELVAEGCQVIVIACNTVSTTLINELRQQFSVPFVPVEPMIEQAAKLTKTGVIAVCATPITLASDRYKQLRTDYAQEMIIVEPDCRDWAAMIQNDVVDHAIIATIVNDAIYQQADVIVLGCTHYHWIEAEIKQLAAGRAEVLQPEPIILERLKQELEQLT